MEHDCLLLFWNGFGTYSRAMVNLSGCDRNQIKYFEEPGKDSEAGNLASMNIVIEGQQVDTARSRDKNELQDNVEQKDK